MSRSPVVRRLLDEFRRRRPLRAGSLIVTVFGDTIAQHGNAIWLGSLIRFLEPFGPGSRLVRTAVYRLCKDDWLKAERVGRRSNYGYSETGRALYEKAARRIYGDEPGDWDGTWTLVLASALEDAERDRLRRELQWLGFGPLLPHLLAHPTAERRSLDETLDEMGCADRVAVLNARTEDLESHGVMGRLAWASWRLDELEVRYDAFINRYRPALAPARRPGALDDEECLRLRTMLIHDYRRILLRDADLPAELLPDSWSGGTARRLTRDLYRAIHQRAERFVVRNLVTTEGPLPPADRSYLRRFGGLESG